MGFGMRRNRVGETPPRRGFGKGITMTKTTHDHDSPSGATPALVYLSGPHRGKTVALSREVETLPDSDSGSHHAAGDHHATLLRRGKTYELRVGPGMEAWVNGEPVTSMVLASGDVMELGRGGTVLRYRIYTSGLPGHKTLPEVFADCLDCAQYGGRTPAEKAAIFLSAVPRELATQTSTLFRTGVLFPIALFLISGVFLELRGNALEERFSEEVTRVTGLAELMAQEDPTALADSDLDALRAEMEETLAGATERLDRLEARSGAVARVIAAAHRSTIFLQGSYGFEDPASGRPLRLLLGPDGHPVLNPFGDPALTPEGDGPELEIFYTGTGFVATDDGLILSNRHVAIPWESDSSARTLLTRGFRPVMRRFQGFLPESETPFDVSVVLTSEDEDLAVLSCSGVTGRVPAIPLNGVVPGPGDEVVVMGYPLGIGAIMARAESALVEELRGEARLDFWQVARRLAEESQISPLATRGIVGQVTSGFLVYDAETASGGSGGPVLDMGGRVVAINTAILPEFGGSNLGVPASRALALLERARDNKG